MLGAGFQLTRGRNGGEDPFYSTAKARKAHQRIDQLRRAQSDVSNGRSANPKESRQGQNESAPHKQKLLQNITSEPSASSSSNFERFLESVTPSVPAQYLSKTSLRERKVDDEYKNAPYFVLGDIWESFAEWSAYGTGVPLVLNSKDRVIQYYVPSLSAIQIYANTHALNSSLKEGRPGDGSDSDFRDSSSDVSSDSEFERVSARVDHISLRDQQHHEDLFSDDGEPLSTQGSLIFEYLERDLPYIREPLADKVFDLAAQFPKLKTLRSCDLLPSSWFSVAWYPIYRIPTGPTLKDLDACFLTYHSLHTPSADEGRAQSLSLMKPRESDKMSLPVFGLASYKFRGSLWTPEGGSEHQLVNSLFQAADKWLHSCHVNHPDFLFFCRR